MSQAAKITVTYGLGNVKLAPAEEILGFEIDVSGGEFEGISSLPKGWRIAIDNKSAGKTVMNADLSFGSETLNLPLLQEITLKLSYAEDNMQHFKVLGHLLVTNGANERRVSLAKANFLPR